MALNGIDPSSIPTVASQLRARLGDDRMGYVLDDERYTWHQVALQSAVRGAVLRELLRPGIPHIGVLLENTPEYLMLAGGAAFAGGAIVGINPTRRGEELAKDIRHADCQLIITDNQSRHLLEGLDLGAVHTTLYVDSDEYRALLAKYADTPVQAPESDPSPAAPLFLLFTSGSTSAPKLVVCSTARMAISGIRASEITGVSRDDICYSPMPLFHGNALMALWSSALHFGAPVVLRRKFSASKFLDDIREHNATFFTYVGRTIAYILAQPETQADGKNNLRAGFGTEASILDRKLFEERFNCKLIESYGSSENGVIIGLTPDSPPGSLGLPRNPADEIAVVNSETGEECERARFDEHGALLNPTEAIGELVNKTPGQAFEGYYNNKEATESRMRGGWFWSGDLGYRDAAGFFYFAGRNADWLRVDSENFASSPIEEILRRFPGVVMVAVYAVPDPRTGDQVMAAIELAPGASFDAAAFDSFLTEQKDLGTKWAPRFVRVASNIPLTANNKVNKQPLRVETWLVNNPIFWRVDPGSPLQPFTSEMKDALHQKFVDNGRVSYLPAGAIS